MAHQNQVAGKTFRGAGVKLPRGLVLPLAAGFAPVLLAFVLFFEGMQLKAYQDTGGVWTICAGHTKGVRPGDVATTAQCTGLLWEDLTEARTASYRQIPALIPWLCRVAVVDFAFQYGEPKLSSSTLRRRLNAGDLGGGANEFLRWVYVGGQDCRKAESNCSGIVTRAQARRELCLAGVP